MRYPASFLSLRFLFIRHIGAAAAAAVRPACNARRRIYDPIFASIKPLEVVTALGRAGHCKIPPNASNRAEMEYNFSAE